MSNYSWTWNTDREPNFSNMSTLPTPSESTVRRLADDVRDMDISDERVSVDFQGLIPESHAATILDQLLFNIWRPFRYRIDVEGNVRFSPRETVEVENVGDVYVRAFVVANDGDVTDVDLTAYPA